MQKSKQQPSDEYKAVEPQCRCVGMYLHGLDRCCSARNTLEYVINIMNKHGVKAKLSSKGGKGKIM